MSDPSDVVLVRVSRPLLDHVSMNDSSPVVILGIERAADGTYDMVLRSVVQQAPRVGTARQGWRARLANVERLLTNADTHESLGDVSRARKMRADVLTEVRSMIDNQQENE